MCEILKALQDPLKDIESDCFNNTNTEEILKAAEPTLTDMPVEIILKICSFLDSRFLKYSFSKVCQRFEDILADDHLWKYWVQNKMNGCFPAIPNLHIYEESEIDWEELCVEIDSEKEKWCDVKNTTKHIIAKDAHYASVDAVLLLNKGGVCVSGGRDRSLALWNVLEMNPEVSDLKPIRMRHDAHVGWIWDLAADNADSATILYSASWDNTVKAWDLAADFNCVETFKCGMSALSVVASDKTVMAGLYSNKVLSFDLRSGGNPISSYKAHKGPVLALSSHKNMVASISEDKTLAIWDKVAGKIMRNNIKISRDKQYPVCINWSSTAMYIGDSVGFLHLFNPEDFTFVRSHTIWGATPVMEPNHKIAGCYQSNGNIIVCSDQGQIKFLYNCQPPKEYSTIETSTVSVTKLQYMSGVLAVGTCETALEFWIPNTFNI
ncbi:F-box/WD repeat-containing protein 9-like [Pieris brassicae]|uniref:F-box/WD repeat-containing protein 9-like n=1 Tax=Pieris brassicae TaxID=7116 RepID=UPI001E65FB8D|nr:F-box/WD repeat-containing protein 9-like [Pieris brassicae]